MTDPNDVLISLVRMRRLVRPVEEVASPDIAPKVEEKTKKEIDVPEDKKINRIKYLIKNSSLNEAPKIPQTYKKPSQAKALSKVLVALGVGGYLGNAVYDKKNKEYKAVYNYLKTNKDT